MNGEGSSTATDRDRSQMAVDWDRRGLVFDIRRFSTHDGPGIRTTVFTKGCPLRCLWCQNPEGIELKRQLFYFRDKCIGCHTCIPNCPEQAISPVGNKISVDRQKCKLSGICVDVCPTLALNFDSREMTVREVVDEILLDRDFFHETGGLTITGGDPTVQHAFNINILKACHSLGIHTAIETSLYADPKIIAAFLPHLSLLIADFKVFDEKNHEAWTGVSNDLIKQNFTWVIRQLNEIKHSQSNGEGMDQTACDLLVRIPMIPGHTATPENLLQIGQFFLALDPETQIELLNYNPLAKNKYHLLEQDFLFEKNPRMFTEVEMAGFVRVLTEIGIHAFHE